MRNDDVGQGRLKRARARGVRARAAAVRRCDFGLAAMEPRVLMSGTPFFDPNNLQWAGGNYQTLLVAQGGVYNGAVGTFTVRDPSTQWTSTYSASVVWGDGTASDAQLVADGNNTYTVYGQHNYLPPSAGTAQEWLFIEILETRSHLDPSLPADAPTVLLYSSESALLPINGELSDGAINAPDLYLGQNYNGAVANFSIPDPADASHLHATVDFGDGNGAQPASLEVHDEDELAVVASHTFSAASTAVHVRITDDRFDASAAPVGVANGQINVQPFLIQGRLADPGSSADEGTVVSGAIAAFTTPAPFTDQTFDDALGLTHLHATVDYGDGQGPQPATLAWYDGPIQNEIVVSGSHAFTDAYGEVPLRVAVTDDRLAPGAAPIAIASGHWYINPHVALAGVGTLVASNGLFNGELARFSMNGPAGAWSSSFTASINWGDGGSSVGQVIANDDGSFSVMGEHTYVQTGSDVTLSPTVSVVESRMGFDPALPEGIPATQTYTEPVFITIPHAAIVAPNLQLTDNQPFEGSVASFNLPDSTAEDFSATISWGDGHTSAGTITANDQGGFDVTGANTYGPGRYTLTVTVQDNRAPRDAGATAPTLNETAKVVVLPPAVSGEAMDVAAVGEQNFDGVVAKIVGIDVTQLALYGASIGWGDGSSGSAGRLVVQDGSVWVYGSHVYEASGAYNISIELDEQIPAAWNGGPVYSPFPIAWNGLYTPSVPVGSPILRLSGQAVVAPGVMDGEFGTPVVTLNEPFYGILATFFPADPQMDISHLHAALLLGDGSAPRAAQLSWNDAGQLVVTVPGLVITDTSPMVAQVRITDDQLDAGANTIALVDGSLSVLSGPYLGSGMNGPLPTNLTPTTAVDVNVGTLKGINFNALQGRTFNGVVGTLTLNAGAALPVVTITWDDGTHSAGVLAQGDDGTYTVTGTHIFTAQSTYYRSPQVTLTAQTGDSSLQVLAYGYVLPDSEPLGLNATYVQLFQNENATMTIARFVPPEGSTGSTTDYQVVIDWGDGQTTAGTLTPRLDGTFDVSGTHEYTAASWNNATVTVSGPSGNFSTKLSLGPQPNPVAAQLADALPLDGLTIQGVIGTFVDTSSAQNGAAVYQSNYAALIDWGDGQVSQGTIAQQPDGSYVVSGAHTYAAAGEHDVKLIVRRSDWYAPGSVMWAYPAGFVDMGGVTPLVFLDDTGLWSASTGSHGGTTSGTTTDLGGGSLSNGGTGSTGNTVTTGGTGGGTSDANGTGTGGGGVNGGNGELEGGGGGGGNVAAGAAVGFMSGVRTWASVARPTNTHAALALVTTADPKIAVWTHSEDPAVFVGEFVVTGDDTATDAPDGQSNPASAAATPSEDGAAPASDATPAPKTNMMDDYDDTEGEPAPPANGARAINRVGVEHVPLTSGFVATAMVQASRERHGVTGPLGKTERRISVASALTSTTVALPLIVGTWIWNARAGLRGKRRRVTLEREYITGVDGENLD